MTYREIANYLYNDLNNLDRLELLMIVEDSTDLLLNNDDELETMYETYQRLSNQFLGFNKSDFANMLNDFRKYRDGDIWRSFSEYVEKELN